MNRDNSISESTLVSVNRSEVNRLIWLRCLLYIVLSTTSIVMLFPFFWMVTTALKAQDETLLYPPKWLPVPAHLENFVAVWNVRPFGNWLVNSLIVASTVTILQLITSSLAAYAFSRLQFPGRDKIFLIYLGTLMIPAQVTLIPNYIVIHFLGWVNTYTGLILPVSTSAFGTFLLRQFFLTIPQDLQDAASMDGAGHWLILRQIILPLTKSALSALAIFSFVNQWNSFLWPLVVTSTDEKMTITVGLSAFLGQYAVWYNLLMAASSLSMIPMLVLFVALQRQFVEGIALTGLAGR